MHERPWSGNTLSCALAVWGVLASGCALRFDQTEHYIGPTWFRYAQPPEAQAYTTQTLQIGLAGEAGRQWGLSLGAVERIAAAPRCACDDTASAPPMPEWITPLSPFPPPEPGTWHFSLLYLRAAHVRAPRFVRRATYGATATAGSETNALSVGVTTRTRTTPADNAVSVLSFDARHPLALRFVVWPSEQQQHLPTEEISKEVTR